MTMHYVKTIFGLILISQNFTLAPTNASASPEGIPLRYYVIDMGPFDGPPYYQDWGLNDSGDIVGFHRPMILPDGSPAAVRTYSEEDETIQPPTDGGGSVWMDQNGNGLPDPEYSDGTGKCIQEKLDIGVEVGQPGAVVADIGDSGHVAGLAYDDDFTLHMARWQVDPDKNHESLTRPALGPESSGWITINNHGDVLDSEFIIWPLNGPHRDLKETLRGLLPDEPSGPGKPYYGLIQSLDFNDDQRVLFTASKYVDGELKDSFFYTYSRDGDLDCTSISPRGTGLINNHNQMVLYSHKEKTTTIRFPDGTIIPTTQDLPNMVLVNPSNPHTGSPAENIDLDTALSWCDLNDQGALVGYKVETMGFLNDPTPYLWTRAYGMVNLNDLVFKKPEYIQLTHALKINTYGQILALGKMDGAQHVFLLQPREGLDRWWAPAGKQEILSIHWTVRIEGEPSERLTCTLSVASEAPWSFASNVDITVIPVGMDSPGDSISLTPGETDIGDLIPGLYMLRISGLTVPDRPAIGNATFTLETSHQDIELAARLVADAPSYTLDKQAVAVLAEQYRPVLFLEATEDYYPVPIETTWGHSDVLFSERCSWCNGLPVWGDSAAIMDLSRFGPAPSSNPRCREVFNPSPVHAYASVLQRDLPHELAINYFFHYPRSNWGEKGGFNTHEGDWEGITVFLALWEDQWLPQSVAYSQHARVGPWEGGVVVPWFRLTGVEDKTHPPVFVGLGGHASYPTSGTDSWQLGRYTEFHRGGRPIHDYTVTCVEPVGDLCIDNPWDWLLYPGHWGRMDIENAILADDDGPPGPMYLDEVTRFPLGLRWFDPWAWAGLLQVR